MSNKKIRDVLRKWIKIHNQSGKSTEPLKMRDIKKQLDESETYDLISALAQRANKTKRRIAARLYLAYGIPYDEFGIEKKEMETVFSPSKSHLSALLSLQQPQGDEAVLFYDEYATILNRHIEQANKTISIYDYLAISPSLEYYHEANRRYLDFLEGYLIKRKDVIYTRVISLSIEKYRSNEPDILAEVISSCSISMYKHFVRCFSSFNNRFNLILANAPNRPYSYGLIDDRYVISELFQFENLEIVPSILFINEVTPTSTKTKLSDLLDTYQNDFRKFNTIKGEQIYKGMFLEKTFQCFTELETKLSILDKEQDKATHNPMDYNAKVEKTKKELDLIKEKLNYCRAYLQ